MRLSAQVLDDVCVDNTNVDVVDPEKLWVSEKDWLHSCGELGLSKRSLWHRLDVMDLTSRGNDDDLGLESLLGKLRVNVLHHLGENVIEIEELKLTGRVSVADQS